MLNILRERWLKFFAASPSTDRIAAIPVSREVLEESAARVFANPPKFPDLKEPERNIRFVGVMRDGQEIDLEMDETGLVIDAEGRLDPDRNSYELVPVKGGLRLHCIADGSLFLTKVIPVERSQKARERARRVLDAHQASVERLERIANS